MLSKWETPILMVIAWMSEQVDYDLVFGFLPPHFCHFPMPKGRPAKQPPKFHQYDMICFYNYTVHEFENVLKM